MAKKTKNEREPFTNIQTDERLGRDYLSTVSLGKVSTVEAEFSRPRPTPLSTTAMIVTKTNYTDGGTGAQCYRLNRYTYKGTKFFAYSTGQSALTTDEAFAAGNIAATKAASNMSSNGFGESLAEAKMTANMIGNRVALMGRFAENVRRGLWSRPGMRKPSVKAALTKGSKRMANHWLEFQYGWTPLINDIWDLLQALDDGLATRGMKVSSRSSHTVQVNGASATARAGISGVVRNPVAYNLNRYGLLNPWLLAWELTTLSFVFDWFIPVSRTLGGLTATAGLSDVTRWEIDHRNTITYRAGRYCDLSKIEVRTQDQYVRRNGSGLLTVYNKGAALSAGQIGSAVALLRQRV